MTALVTESKIDAEIWSALLSIRGIEGVRVVGSDGRSEAISRAHTILVAKRDPVALVLATDTHDPQVAESARANARHFVRMGAGDIPGEVFVVHPSCEALLLANEEILSEVFQQSLSEGERVRAEYEPRRVIEEHFGRNGVLRLLERLRRTPDGSSFLATHPRVDDIIDHLRACLRWEQDELEPAGGYVEEALTRAERATGRR